jgi:hypothetical protein
MGMHLGLVAVKTTVPLLREAFFRTWPHFELVIANDDLADGDAVSKWQQTQQKPGSAMGVFAFWQEGPWAVLLDPTYVLASDETALKSLSAEFGTVASFVVETTSGSAFFCYCVNGSLRRKISNDDSVLSTAGEPIPEEAGLDVSRFYMNETEALWTAFGISPYQAMDGAVRFQAICVLDRTDYSKLVPDRPRPAPRKSWWKLW